MGVLNREDPLELGETENEFTLFPPGSMCNYRGLALSLIRQNSGPDKAIRDCSAVIKRHVLTSNSVTSLKILRSTHNKILNGPICKGCYYQDCTYIQEKEAYNFTNY